MQNPLGDTLCVAPASPSRKAGSVLDTAPDFPALRRYNNPSPRSLPPAGSPCRRLKLEQRAARQLATAKAEDCRGISEIVITKRQGPSMRRPIPVKSFFCSSVISSIFSVQPSRLCRHPSIRTRSLSDFRSVPVGCSRFIRRCYLVSVLRFRLYEGSWART